MTITTTLTWTRYDGTPETLPEAGADVLLAPLWGGTKTYKATLCRSTRRFWQRPFDERPIAIGDLWAPWPEAPEAV